MTAKEDIALQLTLKALDKLSCPTASEYKGSKEYNEIYANHIADCYNTIYNKIQTHNSN